MSLKLVRVLMRLAGESVVVELKNGTVVQGVVVGVDVSMNTHLTRVTLSVRGGNPVKVDSLSVRGSTVRYFILPDSLNLEQLLVEQVSKTQRREEGGAAARGGRGGAAAGDSRGGARGGRGRGRGGRGGDRGGRGRGRGDRGGGRG